MRETFAQYAARVANEGLERARAVLVEEGQAAAEDARRRLIASTPKKPGDEEMQAWAERTGEAVDPRLTMSHYAQSIVCEQVDADTVFVGLSGDYASGHAGLSPQGARQTIEYGSMGGIPARPHLGPARSRAAERIERRLQKGGASADADAEG